MGNATAAVFALGSAEPSAESRSHGAGGGAEEASGHTEPRQCHGDFRPCSCSVLCLPRPDKGAGCWTCCDLPDGWTLSQTSDLMLLLLLTVLLLHLLAWPLVPALRVMRLSAVALGHLLCSAFSRIIGLCSRTLSSGKTSQRASAEATGPSLLSQNQVATMKAYVDAVMEATKQNSQGEPSSAQDSSGSAAKQVNWSSDEKRERIIEEEITEELIMDEIQSDDEADGFVTKFGVDGRVNESRQRQAFCTSSPMGNSKHSAAKQLQEFSTIADGEETQGGLAMLANISEQMHVIMENQRDHKKQLEELQVKAMGVKGQLTLLGTTSAVLHGANDVDMGSSRVRCPLTSKNS